MKTRWTPEKKAAAALMWSQGMVCREIARQFGVSFSTIEKLAQNNRDQFPKRPTWRDLPKSPTPIQPPAERPDRVIRTTITGAKVTLPRVAFIDGSGETTSFGQAYAEAQNRKELF